MSDAPLVDHFLMANHHEDEFVCTVLHVGKGSGNALQVGLLRKEAFWTQRLDTVAPAGLNMGLDFSSFL